MKLRSADDPTVDLIVEQQKRVHALQLKIVTTKAQARTVFDEQSLEWMISSLKAVGQLHPIHVRRLGELFLVIDGERRLRALRALGRETVDAIIEEGSEDEANDLLTQIVSAIHREDLSPLDRAHAISRLILLKEWSASQAAEHVGLSNTTVTRLLSLLKLPLAIQDLIASGKIPASAGYDLSLISDESRQAELARELSEKTITRDGVTAARKADAKQVKAKSTGKSRVTAMLGAERSVTVTGSDLSLQVFIETLEEVLTKARKVRPQGVELSTFISLLKDQSKSAS